MKKPGSYNPKELKIINAVLALVKEGEDADRITARQIATAAGIGKSTIYEHFRSKEEILSAALGYFLTSELEQFEKCVTEQQGFKNKMFAVYEYVLSKLENPNSIFRSVIGKQAMKCRDDVTGGRLDGQFAETASYAMGIFGGILARGAEEGIIPPPADREYVAMAFTGNIFSLCKGREDRLLSRRALCENAYKMLVKVLN